MKILCPLLKVHRRNWSDSFEMSWRQIYYANSIMQASHVISGGNKGYGDHAAMSTRR